MMTNQEIDACWAIADMIYEIRYQEPATTQDEYLMIAKSLIEAFPGVYDSELQCDIIGEIYDHDDDQCLMILGPDCCADMQGAIRLATRKLPNVRVIRTVAFDKADTMYLRGDDNEWTALTADEVAMVKTFDGGATLQ